MESSLLTHLTDLTKENLKLLPSVTWRRMFGCDAAFAGGTIFALIWKTGRIGIKLPQEQAYGELAAIEGTSPWQAGDRVMSHWLLVPESFHDEPQKLSFWLRRAHELALVNPSKSKREK